MGKSNGSRKKAGLIPSEFRMALTPGAHVKVWCDVAGFGFWHHGIVTEVQASDIRVIHFAYPEGVADASDRSIVDTSLSWFVTGGCNPCLEDDEPDFDLLEVVQRARSLLGRGGYLLPVRNCEHFASWCRSKTPRSWQVDQAGNTALIAAAVFVAMGIALKLFAIVPFA